MSDRIVTMADGARTRLRDTGGDGTPLVLLHGLANSLEIWDRVAPALAARRRLIAFDLPGFGTADRPSGAYDTDFFVRHVSALLEQLDLGPVDLVGSSLGASIALHTAAAHPAAVRRLVLAAPGGFGPRVHPLMRLAALPLIGGWLARPHPANNRRTLRLALHNSANLTTELQSLTDRYAARPGSARSFVRTLTTGVGLGGARHLDRTADAARRVTQPTLVVWGRQDRVFPVANAACAVALLPAATLCLMEACGHYPQWEQPDIFARAVLEHLS